MEGTYYPTKPTSLPPPHPSAPSPSSPRSLEETLLVILFVCNIVMISSLFPLHHHHHHSSSSWDLNLMGMDCFDSLQVDLKKAFHEKKLPGIGSYPVRLAEATGGRLVTSVLPSNIFLSADTLFVYDFASWAELGTNFTYRIAQSCWEEDASASNKACDAYHVGNYFSIVSSFMRKVSNVKPLDGASLNVPVQTSFLGALILYMPNDLYSVMDNTDQWYTTFSDCEILMESYSKVDWSGVYYDQNGAGHNWSCGGCSSVMNSISQSCHILAQAANQTGSLTA